MKRMARRLKQAIKLRFAPALITVADSFGLPRPADIPRFTDTGREPAVHHASQTPHAGVPGCFPHESGSHALDEIKHMAKAMREKHQAK